MIATRGHYIGRKVDRVKQLKSGLYISPGRQTIAQDNAIVCTSVGDADIRTCKNCEDKRDCKRSKCSKRSKLREMVARRGDIVHYKPNFCQKLRYNQEDYVFITPADVIAIERDDGEIKAVGSMVVIRLKYEEKMGRFYVPDMAQAISGDFWGEVVAIGPDFNEKDLKTGDRLTYLRAEGYRFKTFYGEEELLSVKERWCYARS